MLLKSEKSVKIRFYPAVSRFPYKPFVTLQQRFYKVLTTFFIAFIASSWVQYKPLVTHPKPGYTV